MSEVRRLRGHTAPIYLLMPFGTHLISICEHQQVYLWNLTQSAPLPSSSSSSSSVSVSKSENDLSGSKKRRKTGPTKAAKGDDSNDNDDNADDDESSDDDTDSKRTGSKADVDDGSDSELENEEVSSSSTPSAESVRGSCDGVYFEHFTLPSRGPAGTRVTCIMHPHTYINKIVISYSNGDMQLWNVRTKRLIHTFNTLQWLPSSLSSSVISSGDSSSSKGASAAEMARLLGDHDSDEATRGVGVITSVVQSPAVDVVAVGMDTGLIAIHNLRVDTSVMMFRQSQGSVTSMAFRSDGFPHLASGSSGGHIVIWNLEKKQLHTIVRDAHDGQVVSLHFLPNEPILVSSGVDNSIKVSPFMPSTSQFIAGGACINID
jgi:WD40 repeat protein